MSIIPILAVIASIALTACAAPPQMTSPPPEIVRAPEPIVLFRHFPEDIAALKAERALSAAMRGERDRCRKRLEDLERRLTEARTKVMSLLQEVQGLRGQPLTQKEIH